jgi:ribonuclease Y
MSIKLILILLTISSVCGVVLGYVLRLLITLSQRGSLELEIKQKLFEAREKAKRIIEDAEHQSEKLSDEQLAPLKDKEDRIAKLEERLFTREELLDERERSLTEEDAKLSQKEREIKNLKADIEEELVTTRETLSKIANLSEEQAQSLLLTEIEKTYKDAILSRIQKLEANGKEMLEAKAKDIPHDYRASSCKLSKYRTNNSFSRHSERRNEGKDYWKGREKHSHF